MLQERKLAYSSHPHSPMVWMSDWTPFRERAVDVDIKISPQALYSALNILMEIHKSTKVIPQTKRRIFTVWRQFTTGTTFSNTSLFKPCCRKLAQVFRFQRLIARPPSLQPASSKQWAVSFSRRRPSIWPFSSPPTPASVYCELNVLDADNNKIENRMRIEAQAEWEEHAQQWTFAISVVHVRCAHSRSK